MYNIFYKQIDSCVPDCLPLQKIICTFWNSCCAYLKGLTLSFLSEIDARMIRFLYFYQNRLYNISHLVHLCFRDTSRIVHIKIVQKDGCYGLTERVCTYPTLLDLVLHYEENSISEHNNTVDITLRFPVRGRYIEDYYEAEPIYGL